MNDIVQSEEPTGVTVFELPNVEGVIVGTGDGSAGMPTAGQVEAMHRQAYEEGFASGQATGYEDGLRTGEAAMRERLAALDGLVSNLAAPLAELDQEMIESVGELAVIIARHLVRREIRLEPGEVVAVVRATLAQLPIANRGMTIRLNPEDVELVRDALSLGDDPARWRLEPDPLIARGGCLVETESSRIDATVESRLATIASQMFGGERETDNA